MEGYCCPKDSLGPLLKGNEKAKGTKIKSAEGVEFYVAENSMKYDRGVAVVMYSDVWGWDSGRVRVLADYFANALKCLVVVPKLQPPLEGGTDGDALPPSFEINAETRPTFMKWIKDNGTETFAARNAALYSDLKKRGIKACFAVGFCWGGWASFRTAAAVLLELKGILIYHPSVQLEGVFGGDPSKLASQVKCPVALHVCSNDDAKLYDKTSGVIVKTLRKNGVATQVEYYPDMLHGFMTRGDMSNALVNRDVLRGIELGVAFIRSNM